MANYETTIIEMINSTQRVLNIKPLLLGGAPGVSGGIGGPPGGFIGTLTQRRVSYDLTEAAISGSVSSGISLLDNLNHIRYRIQVLEDASGVVASGGGHSIYYSGILVGPEPALNFIGNVQVVDNPANSRIDIMVLAGSGVAGSGGVTDHNQLSNLQGGSLSERYHLTNAQVNALHSAVTVVDSPSIDFSLSGQQITASAIFGTTATTVAQGNHTHPSGVLTVVASGGVPALTASTLQFPSGTVINMGNGKAAYVPKITENLNMNGYRVTNVNTAEPVGADDAITLDYLGHWSNRGWISPLQNYTLTAIDSTTIRVSNVDLTTNFINKASKISWYQNSAQRFGVVASANFINPHTYLHIIDNTSYPVLTPNGTYPVSILQFTFDETPLDFPHWFNYTPVFSGFSGDPTVVTSKFSISGRTCRVIHAESADGTSSTTGFSITLPVKPVDNVTLPLGTTRDNSANQPLGIIQLLNGNGTASLFKSGGSVWTASLGKRAHFEIFYEW